MKGSEDGTLRRRSHSETLWPCQASLWDGSDPIVHRLVPTLPLFIGPTLHTSSSSPSPSSSSSSLSSLLTLSTLLLLLSYGQDNHLNNNYLLSQTTPRLHERGLLLPTPLHPPCSSRQGQVTHSSLRHRLRRRKQHSSFTRPLWLRRNNQHQQQHQLIRTRC